MLLTDIDRSTFRRAVIVLLPVVVFVAIYSVYAPNVALINPDSDGYLSFDSGRTGGYPFFLPVLKSMVGSSCWDNWPGCNNQDGCLRRQV
jgi:hypothetical protein